MHSPYATGVIPTIPGGTYAVPFETVPDNYLPEEESSGEEELMPAPEVEASSSAFQPFSPNVQAAAATSSGGLSRSVQLGAHSGPAGSQNGTNNGGSGTASVASGLITPQERETSGRSRLAAPEPAAQ